MPNAICAQLLTDSVLSPRRVRLSLTRFGHLCNLFELDIGLRRVKPNPGIYVSGMTGRPNVRFSPKLPFRMRARQHARMTVFGQQLAFHDL